MKLTSCRKEKERFIVENFKGFPLEVLKFFYTNCKIILHNFSNYERSAFTIEPNTDRLLISIEDKEALKNELEKYLRNE